MKFTPCAILLSLSLVVAAEPGNEFQPGGGFGARKGSGNQGGNEGGKKDLTSSAVAALSTSQAVASTTTSNSAASTATASASDSSASSGDAQTSLTLDPNVIAKGFEDDGQDVPAAGQVASLTSSNNFINFCLTAPNVVLTNGKQVTAGSCNPAPMGLIPSSDNMPSAKFSSPKNGDTIAANTPFTISMAIQNMQTGFFVNAEENYFSAPQQLNNQGQIIGHSHVVVESLSALDQTTPTNPKNFAFFKGLNAAAVQGVLTADVTSGLPAGVYKLSSINTAANHQPLLVPIAQHGSLDDAVYFTVSDSGAANSTASADAIASTDSSVAASSATVTDKAAQTQSAGGGKGGKQTGGKGGKQTGGKGKRVFSSVRRRL